MTMVHWDDVPPQQVDRGDLHGRRRRLATPAGAVRLGLSRYELDPGRRVMPVHAHADEEELFVVLAGGGISVEGDEAFAIGAGDVVLYPAGGRPHTVLAGAEGIDVLAFGSGSDTSLTWLPRPNVMWAGTRWLPLDGPNPFIAEAECGPLQPPEPSEERPSTIARIDEVEAFTCHRGNVGQETRVLGAALGAVRCGMSEIRVEPGCLSNIPHCHSAEEELFVVTGGDGALELLHPDGTAESMPVHTGSVVARPAGTGISHTFGAGDGGLTLLAFSGDERSDICFYPRSGKISIRGVPGTLRIQAVDYWDGEE